jgi:hypothetical protein
MKCKVEGCNKQLDHMGVPVEYCDWQQGRCPMQKKAFDWNNKFDRFAALVLVPLMLVFLFVVIYVELS